MGLYTTPRIFVIKRQALLEDWKTDQGEPADTIEVFRNLGDAKRFLKLYVGSKPLAWIAQNERIGKCYDSTTDRFVRIFIKRRRDDT